VLEPRTGAYMRAVIGGRLWRATGVIARRCGGFIAVSGWDDRGTTLTFAVPAAGRAGSFVLGATPANAVLTVGGATLAANDARGRGRIALRLLTAARLAGSFSLVVAGEAGAIRVSAGRFDVCVRGATDAAAD
jgi:hypothetical protein